MRPSRLTRILIAGFLIAPALSAAADDPPGDALAWVTLPSDVLPTRDSNYNDGDLSGPWLSDLQYYDGLWLLGDGYGGLWHSEDGQRWRRGTATQRGVPRSMQNAPVRSVNISENGTVLATFLGGGSRVHRAPPGTPDNQRAPVARSTNGIDWDVRTLPESCGIHFSATDGDGTWIIPGCEGRIMVSQDDGLTWSIRTPGIPAAIAAQGHINGVWVVGTGGLLPSGTNADRGIYYSTNLITWTKAASLPIAAKRIVNVGDRLLLMGTTRYVASSTDGIRWTRNHIGASGDPVLQAAVRHPEYGHVLVGAQCTVMYSRDLIHWTTSYLGGARCAGEVAGTAISDDGRLMASGPTMFGLSPRVRNVCDRPAKRRLE